MTVENSNIGFYTKVAKSPPFSFACGVCGWAYNGNKEEFNNLPVEYICSKCGATKVNFKPLQGERSF